MSAFSLRSFGLLPKLFYALSSALLGSLCSCAIGCDEASGGVTGGSRAREETGSLRNLTDCISSSSSSLLRPPFPLYLPFASFVFPRSSRLPLPSYPARPGTGNVVSRA